MVADSSGGDGPGRRGLIRAIGTGIGATVGIAGTGVAAGDRDEPVSVTFGDQQSAGDAVTVAMVVTDVDVVVTVRHESRGELGRTEVEAETLVEGLEIPLTEPIGAETELELAVDAYQRSSGNGLARDTATVAFDGSLEVVAGLETRLVEADPDAGFDYPYYLYAPARLADAEATPMLVEPTNTGTATDEFDRHLEAADRTVEDGIGREIADALSSPFLVPVFPRPQRNPVSGDHYVHQLDDTTMAIDDGNLERVDLQLLAMVDDARNRLEERGYAVDDGIMLNGFSAAGNFVDRFAALHPEVVRSVTAGGLNGMAILPLEEAKGRRLAYHIGVANLEEVTGEPFDLEAFREVDQFRYMGELDNNDTIPFDDAWTDDELRETALAVYGHDIQRERFPFCKAVYDEVGVDAVFRSYEDVGHTPRPARADLVEFHERSLAGDDVDEIRADLGGNVPNLRAYIDHEPREPSVGEQVAFDATRSAVWDRDLVEYEWEFGDETATGDLVTHTFEDRGAHNVRLTATDDAGETYEDVVQIRVGSTPADEKPGFGLASGIAALGGFGYLLTRRLARDA
ncbi:PKD domain-containing protein [Natronobacterium texcoconense]|uniref:PKD domain-containing protein n=1 Tax=Natronobacterium texcoconense TaxID=1095778 RepID=A0A1H1G887_NATTX|nr:PKD domain-containing protein [Natronobacterium texcoconense]SDR09269.1 PKD domain-containing protein [Natronobacterium texcoconense]